MKDQLREIFNRHETGFGRMLEFDYYNYDLPSVIVLTSSTDPIVQYTNNGSHPFEYRRYSYGRNDSLYNLAEYTEGYHQNRRVYVKFEFHLFGGHSAPSNRYYSAEVFYHLKGIDIPNSIRRSYVWTPAGKSLSDDQKIEYFDRLNALGYTSETKNLLTKYVEGSKMILEQMFGKE